MKERTLIAELLAPLATTITARGLADDAAVLVPPLGRDIVLTHDMLAAGIHYMPGDPPGDVAWKLLAVNMSDLAAMGAWPLGVLLGLGLSDDEDEAWLRAFVAGLARGLEHWQVALYGGDTVTGLDQTVLGLTAIGQVEPGRALSRSGARPGDILWVSGTIGDAGLGLDILKGLAEPDKYLVDRYRRPSPRMALGRSLPGVATAAMDISDGLLIDAQRLAAASNVGITIELAAIPLSPAAVARTASGNTGPLARAAAGDDYELLFTAPAGVTPNLAGLLLSAVGRVTKGSGLTVIGIDGRPVVPERLGWEH